jgi:hypothetical protein
MSAELVLDGTGLQLDVQVARQVCADGGTAESWTGGGALERHTALLGHGGGKRGGKDGGQGKGAHGEGGDEGEAWRGRCGRKGRRRCDSRVHARQSGDGRWAVGGRRGRR